MYEIIEKEKVIEKNIVTCLYCQKKIDKEDACVFNNGYYCQDCIDEVSELCTYCGQRVSEEEIYVLNDEVYCSDCIDEVSFVCDCCHEREENECNYGDDNIDLCQECYDTYYTRCYECGRLLHSDDANYLDDGYGQDPYCDDCYERENNSKYLHDYGYKPDPVFKGSGNRYFGCELEIDGGGKDEENAREICECANKHTENIYIKTDSSLNDGLEIVTHPMTLKYHMENMPWNEICKIALSLDYRSHDTTTSGLHIHINRTAFGETAKEQEEYIARILYFFESNCNELLKFSRRTESQLNHWAKRYGWKQEPMDILDDAKKNYTGRYACVNITNYSTIEIRIFKGSLKYNTLIASIQLVDAICEAAVNMSDSEIKSLAWSTFVSELDKQKYPQLIKYLKERKLYVNETVEINEESEEE